MFEQFPGVCADVACCQLLLFASTRSTHSEHQLSTLWQYQGYQGGREGERESEGRNYAVRELKALLEHSLDIYATECGYIYL